MTRHDATARKLLLLVRRIARNSPQASDPLQDRAELAAMIADAAVAGRIVIRSGGTDCDGYRSEGLTVLPATVAHFLGYRQGCADGAEGPWFCYVLSEPTPEDFEAAYDPALPALTGWCLQSAREDFEYRAAA